MFNDNLVEDVFLCKEFSFDWSVLRNRLADCLYKEKVDVKLGEYVTHIETTDDMVRVHLASGESLSADIAYNVTYANLNAILLESKLIPLEIKHELAEIALMTPPPDFDQLAVTVMDGPFFSAMPYPSEKLYSLTHVRYTPHFSWVDRPGDNGPYSVAQRLPKETRWRHMVLDAQRYIPSCGDMTYSHSLFEVKTVLVKNERDDDRPILLHQHKDAPRLYSVMGAKIDNIYDLFDAMRNIDPRWAHAVNKPLFT